MTYLKVKLINDSQDKSTAEIVPREAPDGSVVLSVFSENPKMKAHLEKLITTIAYIASPGLNEANFFADSVWELYPNSIYYVNALPEILSWRGYDVSVEEYEAHKSVDLNEFYPDFFKASSADSIIYNAQGQRVVKYVPQGFIAIHSDGRVVAGGKYLNANIDKEGADWTLTKNPYENVSPENRQETKQYMDLGIQDYHPGVEEGAYQDIEPTSSPSFRIDRDYTPDPRESRSLYEHFHEKLPSKSQSVPSSYPSHLAEGSIVYSPQTGQAFDSKFWPPSEIDLKNYDWYVFTGSGLSDEEKDLYAPIRGLSPELISGVQNGIVQSEKGLDVSGGFRLGGLSGAEGTGDLNARKEGEVSPNAVPNVKYEISDMLSSDWKKLYRKAKEKLKEISKLTHTRIDESLESMKIENLRGAQASFTKSLYPHQKAIVKAMTEESQYDVFGGPKGWHGYFLNVKMGLGKTASVAAANAIMRNRGLVKNGSQTTLVTAPNKNLYVWQSELGKFLGEHAVVIDGSREKRIEQWEDIMKKAAKNELPSFIIFGSSQFRYVRGDADEDSEDSWELGVDAKYIQLLSMGGRGNNVEIPGNHVGILTVDESGQYVNPDSSRHRALHSIIDSVYHGKGITWTLNGTISGNSATDTISELSFINKFVRDNYLAVVQEYTKTDRNAGRESKAMGRRVWKDYNRLGDFFYTFGAQIYSLDGRAVAGDKYGFMQTDDQLTPIGEEWSRVYFQAEKKLSNAIEQQSGTKAMGLLSILIGATMGALSPERMLEYDLATREIVASSSKGLDQNKQEEMRYQVQAFLNSVTDSYSHLGRLPKKGLSISERNELYRYHVSDDYRMRIANAVLSWDCPYTNTIVRNIQNDFEQSSEAGVNMKIGVASFSRISVNKIASRLRDIYSSNDVLIQVVDGGVKPENVDLIQKRHQSESERNVITLVTGAGVYGLSLPSDRSYRAPAWNSAKGGQYDARFHRKAEQKNVSTVVIPQGITQYMRELENKKGSMASSATNVLLDIDDSQDELVINSNSVSSLLDKLQQYRPRVLGRGEY